MTKESQNNEALWEIPQSFMILPSEIRQQLSGLKGHRSTVTRERLGTRSARAAQEHHFYSVFFRTNYPCVKRSRQVRLWESVA